MIRPLTSCPSATPLQVRSGYSLLRGTAMPGRLIELACQMGHRRLALTDVNNLYAATLFFKQAKQQGLSPILGAQLVEANCGTTAIVVNQTGYENLCRLITRIQLRDAAPLRIGAAQIAADPPPADIMPDLAAAPPQSLPRRLAGDMVELSPGINWIFEDAAFARQLLEQGMDRRQMFLGVDPPCQAPAALGGLLELAQSQHLPLTAVGKAMMGEAGDMEVAHLLAAIRSGTTYDGLPGGDLPPARAVLRTSGQLADELMPLACRQEALANNDLIASCAEQFQLLPRNPVFPAFPCPGGRPAVQYLRQLCMEGMARRYGDRPAMAVQRLDRELGVIERLGFVEYFLVVWDIVQFARRRGAPVAGRGSGASSLVAYLLGITNVCPLAYDIPFERFLHENREDFPDLDVDFCWRIRDEVIDYAFGRWGSDRVAMVSMHGTFQARSALRETAKALGLGNEQISRMEQDGDFSALDADLPDADDPGQPPPAHAPENPGTAFARRYPPRPAARAGANRMERIIHLSRRILHLPHNLSVHPGGIVISPRSIDHYVPLQQAAKGVRITQYDKNGVEDIRLVKLDLLGNRNLSTVRYACDLIRSRHNVAIDIESLDDRDGAAIAMLRRADTVGCNQLESPAMRSLIRMIQPADTRDVMKALALIRPGAASIGMKDVFIRRHRGLDVAPSGQAGVDAILGGTHGVMLYEDDVMLVAAALLGGCLGQADKFRKAVQKCHDDQQRLKLSQDFLRRCQANGVDLDYAKSLWVQMAKYNAYSFCRAHAASYALLSYAGVYLKAHYPLEFWASALNNNQSMYPTRVYVEQAKRQGVRFVLPDVNRSQAEFCIDRDESGDFIRVGLGRVTGLGPVHVEAILAARAQRPFEGLGDCIARSHLGREEARSLVLCGALDWTARTRPTLMMELNLFYALGSWRHSRDVLLLSAGPTIPNVPGDYGSLQKYNQQRQILGLSVDEHVLAAFRDSLAGMTDCDSRQLPSLVGKTVHIAGVLEAQRTFTTQRGGEMMFLTLDDEWGLFEASLFPDVLSQTPCALRRYGPYVVTAVVEEQYDAITLSVSQITLPALRQMEAAIA